MPAPSPASSPPPPPARSLFIRVGTLIGTAALASLALSIPAALRICAAEPGGSGLRTWLALAGVALVPTVGVVAVLRAARDGLRAFGGEGATARAIGFGSWLGITVVAITVYGALLRATTHHHALAGVTFALGALAIMLAIAVAVRRFLAIIHAQSPEKRAALLLGAAALLGCALLAALVPLSRAILPATSALLLDLLALAIAAGFASRASFAGRRTLALIGPPLAATVFVFATSALNASPPLSEAIRERAPLFATAMILKGD